MKSCKHCDKAATDWRYGGMNPACPDCVVRELAKSPRHHREAAFDHVMKHRGEVTWLAAEAGILRDIDTPEDLEKAALLLKEFYH